MEEFRMLTIITNLEFLKMSKQTNTEKRVIKAIKDQMGVMVGEVDLQESFIDGMGLDSMDTISIIMAIEDEFKVDLEDELFESHIDYFKGSDIVRMIDTKLGGL
jgi:acyl carrier protein